MLKGTEKHKLWALSIYSPDNFSFKKVVAHSRNKDDQHNVDIQVVERVLSIAGQEWDTFLGNVTLLGRVQKGDVLISEWDGASTLYLVCELGILLILWATLVDLELGLASQGTRAASTLEGGRRLRAAVRIEDQRGFVDRPDVATSTIAELRLEFVNLDRVIKDRISTFEIGSERVSQHVAGADTVLVRKEETKVLSASIVEQFGERVEKRIVGDHEWVAGWAVRTLIDVPGQGNTMSLLNLLHLPIGVGPPRLPLELVGLGPETPVETLFFALTSDDQCASPVVDRKSDHDRRNHTLGEDSVMDRASVGAGGVDMKPVSDREEMVPLGQLGE